MRRFLTGIALAAFLLIPAIVAGCGAKEKADESSGRLRRTPMTRASDTRLPTETE